VGRSREGEIRVMGTSMTFSPLPIYFYEFRSDARHFHYYATAEIGFFSRIPPKRRMFSLF
jgi:hypothetical protein